MDDDTEKDYIIKTQASLSKKCSSTPEPLVHFAPKWYAGSDEYFINL
jgi:hypothetical protein